MLGMEAEMLKGHLDAIVLAALEAGPAHGYAIIETIKQLSETMGGGMEMEEDMEGGEGEDQPRF